MRKDWPELKLYLREEVSGAACESLHRGHVDCVLLALPYTCGDIDAAELFRDRLYVAFPPALAKGLPATVTAASIEPSQLLLLEDGHCLKEHALGACNRPELRAEASMVGTSLHTLVQMVENGLGMTMLPKMALDAGLLDHTHIIARPLEADNAERRIALVWRTGSPREKEFRLLADALKKGAEETEVKKAA